MPFRNDDFTSRQESKIKRSWKLRRKKKRNNVDILPIINNLRVRNFSLSFREKPFLCPYEKKNSSGMGWNDNKVASKNIRKGNNNNKKKERNLVASTSLTKRRNILGHISYRATWRSSIGKKRCRAVSTRWSGTRAIFLYTLRLDRLWSLLLDKKKKKAGQNGGPEPGFCPPPRLSSSRNYFAIVNFTPEIWWKFSSRPLIRNTARGAVKFILRYWK